MFLLLFNLPTVKQHYHNDATRRRTLSVEERIEEQLLIRLGV